MGKKKHLTEVAPAPTINLFAPHENIVDPDLAALFTFSSGPVKMIKSTTSASERPHTFNAPNGDHSPLNGNIQNDSAEDIESVQSSEVSGSETGTSSAQEKLQEQSSRPRKRQKLLKGDNIESAYLNRLTREDARDEAQHRRERRDEKFEEHTGIDDDVESTTNEDDLGDQIPVHESEMLLQHETLDGTDSTAVLDQKTRTVFLGNVSTDAIKSKSARKTLLRHLSSVVENLPAHQPPHKVESLRFRSTAFVSGAGPKKAAFAKKELMDQTTKNSNAYVVYSSEVAARKAAKLLNGTLVLDRHLRADFLASPAKTDHRRCVFVGNISFVDEETVDDTKHDEDEKPRRPKAKEPADAEEGLWRTFSKAGKIESVRVIRDKETRVGKGFAYVQFVNENAVEAALLMNEKKYPPMLPRKLRVMRAKKIKERSGPTSFITRSFDSKGQHERGEQASIRKGQLGSRFQSRNGGRVGTEFKRPEAFVFEGQRASIPRGRNATFKRKKRSIIKPTTRSSRRGAAFKEAGGKRE